jgi:hypothetical protein
VLYRHLHRQRRLPASCAAATATATLLSPFLHIGHLGARWRSSVANIFVKVVFWM